MARYSVYQALHLAYVGPRLRGPGCHRSSVELKSIDVIVRYTAYVSAVLWWCSRQVVRGSGIARCEREMSMGTARV
jgi:hypothetical protein